MNRADHCLVTPLVLTLLLVPASTARADDAESQRIAAVLDGFHDAAARADEERYFDLLAPDAVFFGTDAGERWTRDEFRAYAHPRFESGQGWTYRVESRHIFLSADGAAAWFDEMLSNDKYGPCRGTGVLQLRDGEWKIEQYHLTIPIPNELAAEVVEKIRGSRDPG